MYYKVRTETLAGLYKNEKKAFFLYTENKNRQSPRVNVLRTKNYVSWAQLMTSTTSVIPWQKHIRNPCFRY
jgi:hypothetical protein